MFKKHSRCRACGYGQKNIPEGIKAEASREHLTSVLDLGALPLPNAFRQESEPQPGYYPINLLACPNCGLGQLSVVVDPILIYSHYPYVTSKSATMAAHFESLWNEISEVTKVDSVVEIGSNDGHFLSFAQKQGVSQVLGIDPAKNLAIAAVRNGVPTICGLFDSATSRRASETVSNPDLIIARHVFCHIDDWRAFVQNLEFITGKDSLICIEVPYAQDLIDKFEWDTVYAEHLSYLTIKSVLELLEGTGLRLKKVVKFPIHGGALALFIQKTTHPAPVDKSVSDILKDERCDLGDWKLFSVESKKRIQTLREFVLKLRSEGKRVAGYGASAKGTMWMNACRFQKSEIEFVCDSTLEKLFRNVPGTNIPVVAEDQAYVQCVDYAVLWSWNFEREILEKQAKFREGGGRFIIPVPEIRVV